MGQHYKDQQNKLHFLDSAEHEYMLPAGCVPITDEEAAILSAPPAPTLAEQIADFTAAISAHLDATVHARGYDNILSCASYANSSNAMFKAEALVAIAWRDAVWAYCYAELAKVQAGTRVVPASGAAFIAELPVLAW